MEYIIGRSYHAPSPIGKYHRSTPLTGVNVYGDTLLRSTQQHLQPNTQEHDMLTQEAFRDAFDSYYTAMARSQQRDDAPVPPRDEEWQSIVQAFIDNGMLPAFAAAWPSN